uniref:DHHA2 domain-containing protein n=1 Tax=Mesocestoides corti TaxID=53468 RepID=A0A5K3ELU9_MESCO
RHTTATLHYTGRKFIRDLVKYAWKFPKGPPRELSAIVIDNAGLSDLAKQLQKATPKDLEAADKLEGFMKAAAVTGVSTREAVYEQIKEAKFSIKGLSLWDLLRRDFKRVNADSEHQLEIVCSTITGMDFVELLEHRDFGQVTRRFCEEHGAQVLVCITVGNISVTSSDTSVASAIRLGLVVTALHDHRNLAEKLWRHLMASKVLCLEPPSKESKLNGGAESVVFAATITNKAVTRKQAIPILIEFLRSER